MKKEILFLVIFIVSILCVDLKKISFDKMESEIIHVHMQGAVAEEKTIALPMYSTVADALDKVELLQNADTSTLNPNAILKDADVISISYQKEENESPKVSINTASVAELQTLDGIGPSLAERIVQFRQEEGFFQTIEDLMNVKGIGQSKFLRLKEQVSL